MHRKANAAGTQPAAREQTQTIDKAEKFMPTSFTSNGSIALAQRNGNPQNKTTAKADIEEIERAIRLFHEPGSVVELRALGVGGRKRTDSGYFDDPAKLAQAAAYLSGRADGVYFTLNEINPALLARSANKLTEWAKTTTADHDVVRRRWLGIDLDPERPAGISSTQEELQAAAALADRVQAWLTDRGWPLPVRGMSGNGIHVDYRIDLPNDEAAKRLLERVLQALAFYFDDGQVKIDTSVWNASRIWKLYGTLAAKGSSTADRPHRIARLQRELPDTIGIVTLEQLEAVAAMLPEEPEQPQRTDYRGRGDFDLSQWIEAHSAKLKVAKQGAWKDGGRKWILAECPWNSDHTDNSAFIVQHPNGAIAAGCHHDGCDGNDWRKLRELIEGPREERQARASNLSDRYNGFGPMPTDAAGDDADSASSERRYNTWPYAARDGQMVYLRQVKNRETGETTTVEQPIADFAARITEQLIGEYGDDVYTLEGEGYRGGPFTVEIAAKEFADTGKLIGLLESVSPYDAVLADNRKHIGPAIKKLSSDVRRARRFTRTGWADGRFLIPGREPDDVRLDLPDKLPYAIAKDAQLDKGLAALEALIKAPGAERGAVLLAHVLAAPLARAAGWHNERSGLHIVAKSGSMKTTIAKLFMTLYGPRFNDDDMLILLSGGATRNAIVSLAAAACDMPILFDNFKPNAGDGARGLINLIHAIMEGGDKQRLDRGSNLRQSRPLHTWPIVTGEDLPTGDGAALARMLVLPFEDGAAALERGDLQKAQRNARHLCAVGAAWLEWLESEEGQEQIKADADKLDEWSARWAAQLRQWSPNMTNPLRVARNLAVSGLTLHIAAKHPHIGPIVTKFAKAFEDGIETVARQMGTYTSDSLEAARFLEALRELLHSGQALLYAGDPAAAERYGAIEYGKAEQQQKDRALGWIDGQGGAYLYPTKALEAVRRLGEGLNGVSPVTLYRQLARLGAIRPGKNANTVQIRLEGKNQKMLHILPSALDGAPDDV